MGKLALIILLLPWIANADIEFNYGSLTQGFSTKEQTVNPEQSPVTESGRVIIYGGIAGTACTGNNLTTCDSCPASAGTNASCNSKRVYDNLKITLQYKSNVRGWPLVTNDSDESPNVIGSAVPVPTIAIEADQLINYSFTWGELCGLAGGAGSNTCEGLSSTTPFKIRLGIDAPQGTADTSTGDGVLTGTGTGSTSSDDFITISFVVANATTGELNTTCVPGTDGASGEGVCNFEVFPGDNKAHILVASVPTGFPSAGTDQLAYQKLRVYFTEGTKPSASDLNDPNYCATTATPIFDTINIATKTFRDIVISAGSANAASIAEKQVSGLTNGKAYFFKTASIDKAGNVSSFSKSGSANYCACPTSGETLCHLVIPSQVLGLASDEFDCFIASAVYGSPKTPEVKIFRQFRNQVLNKFSFGKVLVKTYYRHSPPLSKWIKERPYIRKSMKFVFWPLMLWAKSCVTNGILYTQAGILLFLIFFTFLFQIFRRKNNFGV